MELYTYKDLLPFGNKNNWGLNQLLYPRYPYFNNIYVKQLVPYLERFITENELVGIRFYLYI